MNSRSSARLILWIVLALPGAWILGRWAFTPDAYGYGHAIGDSGDWAAWLLMLTLAVTPIRLLFRKQAFAIWLMRWRRDLGLASFAYAAGHTIVYLWNKWGAGVILRDLGMAEYFTGWLAMALFVPLAITSNDKSLRALKRSWKKLHRLVYPAAVLMFLHWALTAFDPMTAYIHIGIMAAIEIVRVTIQARQKAARQ